MPPKKNKILIYCATVFFAMMLAVGSLAMAEENDPEKSISDTLLIPGDDLSVSDSSLNSAAISDTIIPAQINLEPVLYQPNADTILINAFTTRPTVGTTNDATGLISDQSFPDRVRPSTALLRSVVVPGWGQLSNRKYFKAALVLGLESYLIYKAIDKGRQASDWKEKWLEAQNSQDPDLSGMTSIYFSNYSSYRNGRNTQYWLLALTVFLSMFDAYVDAHMSPFPEAVPEPNDLSIGLEYDDEFKGSIVYRF